MDSFHVHLNLTNLKKLGNFFRLIEALVFLVFLSRVISFQFQFQFPVGEYCKKMFSILFSHRFVFVVGNVIVITLFAKSGRDSRPDNHTQKPDTTSNDQHNESVHNDATQSETQSISAQVVTSEPERNQSACARVKIQSIHHEVKMVNIPVMEKNRTCFKRSYSECLEVESYIKPRRMLRRTATEGCGGALSKGRCDEAEVLEGIGDGMSDEEFRVMVEKFIAKQQRSLREEEKHLCFC